MHARKRKRFPVTVAASSLVRPITINYRITMHMNQSGSQDPKIGVSYNDRVRKGLIADFDRIRPDDQCQVVCRVELWYRLRVKGVFLYVTP